MARILGDDWLLPAIDDNTRAWFTTGKLHIQACRDCDALQHPPEEVCRGCQGTDLTFRELGGGGKIEGPEGEKLRLDVVEDELSAESQKVAQSGHNRLVADVQHCPYDIAVIKPGGNRDAYGSL